jgi:hypothetical protein
MQREIATSLDRGANIVIFEFYDDEGTGDGG